MNDFDWMYFVIGLIAYQILKMIVLGIHQAVREHRQQRFINLVSVTFPEHDRITYISVDASDKRALEKMERQLREDYPNARQAGDQDRSSDRQGSRAESKADA